MRQFSTILENIRLTGESRVDGIIDVYLGDQYRRLLLRSAKPLAARFQ